MGILYQRMNIALLLLAVLFPATILAGGLAEERLGAGKWNLGLQGGYANGFSLGVSGNGDGRLTEYIALFPRVGYGLSTVKGESSWYRGSWELLGELSLLFNLQPQSGRQIGTNVLFRYNFLPWERWVPYVEGGAGIGYLDFNLRDQSDGFIFAPQVGVGLNYFVGDRTAINASWRWHHLSNAGTQQPNNGVNGSLIMLGMTYYFN